MPTCRETRAEWTLEETCAEGFDELKINTLLRTFPKIIPKNKFYVRIQSHKYRAHIEEIKILFQRMSKF